MRDNIKGFTLLEVLITIGLLSLVLGYIMVFFGNEIRLYYSKDNDIELKQDARIALDRIALKLRSRNGLTFQAGSDSGMIYEESAVIINTTKYDPSGEINYDFDKRQINEYRDSANYKLVGNIEDFRIEQVDVSDTQKLINIIIETKNSRTDTVKEYRTSVRLDALNSFE